MMIRRPQFERLWADSSPPTQIELQQYIFECNKKQVSRWMREHPSLELAEKQLTELKRIATNLGIQSVSRMGKLDLVRAIQTKEAV